ncbi:MAG: hypothetical protein E6K70_19225 [Planctomycetota bacterium]|nr:MAG: hypothetical protein E6K70_19225 [Planctomycetota bacterium]
MSRWRSVKAKRVLAATDWLDDQTTGWRLACVLARTDWPDFVFAFHDREEVGPKMLAKIAKRTGLRPDDL